MHNNVYNSCWKLHVGTRYTDDACIVVVTAIMCGDLGDPSDGQITFSADTTAPFDFETTATYNCDENYVLTNGSAERTCISSGPTSVGEWNGTAPTCDGQLLILNTIIHKNTCILNCV